METDRLVEKPGLLGYGVGPLQRTKVEAQSCVPQQRTQWDTPMARWAGEGNDWIKFMALSKPRREDVIRSQLESVKQAVEKKNESNGTMPSKKPRDLPHLELGTPEAGKWPTLEIKRDCKTIVDWVNGHAKMKTR